jgi:hypothetical protein
MIYIQGDAYEGLAKVHGRERAIIEDRRMYESNHMFNT